MKKAFVLSLFLMLSCAPQIKRTEVKNEDCFVFLKCLEMNFKNGDKSVCALIGDACRDALKEERKK